MDGNELSAQHSTSNLILNTPAMQQLESIATIMAGSKITIPAHLQGSKSDCMAIAMQAAQWGMNPFAVAQKTHVINGTLGYEAQLVNAVVSSSSKINGSFSYSWFGEWPKILGKFVTKTGKSGRPYQAPGWTPADEKGLGIAISATLLGETKPRTLELLLTQAQVRNSTLWASDPKQQLAYLAVKRWARLYAPDVILGVYTADELDQSTERDITPSAPTESAVSVSSHTVDHEPENNVQPDHRALPTYSTDEFNAKLEQWFNLVESGKATPEKILNMVSSKVELTDEQAEQIKALDQLTSGETE